MDDRRIFSLRNIFLVWFPVVLFTFLHYTTAYYHHWLHDILRRLYYLPIVFAAFSSGKRGSLSVSATVSIVYFPHAFMSIVNRDPAGSIDKALEIVLYNVVALITGFLADRLRRESEKYRSTAENLEEKLDEIKNLEEELVRSEKLKALGEMTAGIAHEIKNPLASIKGAAEIVGDEISTDSPKRKLVDIQKREIDRLQNLLERFLTFARPKPLEMEKLDLKDVVSSAIDIFRTEDHAVSVDFRHDGSYPVMGNRESLMQIVFNLLRNSEEATDGEGCICIELEKSIFRRRESVLFSVTDSGRGIEPEELEKVFNPFFSKKEEGTGLGLSIVSRIVEQHNAHIEVESKVGKGTRFSIYFPESSPKFVGKK